MHWERVVWEQWSLPRYAFILWLAVLGKLKTKDRLTYTDTTCVLCSQDEESHAHLFFSCRWTSLLWAKVRSWLNNNRRMSTLHSAIRGLNTGKKDLNSRMRRVSLGIVVYLIWQERNKRVFEMSHNSVDLMFRRYQILFYTIFYFHEKDPSLVSVGRSFIGVWFPLLWLAQLFTPDSFCLSMLSLLLCGC